MADATTFLDIGYRYNKQGEDEWVRGGKRVRQAGRGVEDQTDKLNKRLRDSQGRFAGAGNAAEKLNKRLRKGGSAAGFFGGHLKKLGLQVAGAFTAIALLTGGVALARQELAAIVRTQAEFSDRMASVRGITRASAEDYATLSARARELGASTRFTATEVADAEVFLARAGFSVRQTYEALPAVLDLAAAAQLDLGASADIASNIMQAFGVEASRSGEIVDVLATIATSSNQDIGQLAEGMKFAGPVASGFGRSIGETAVAIGVLSDAGLQGSLAGTGLRKTMTSLINPTKETRGIIDGLGLTLEDVSPKTNTLAVVLRRLADAGLETEQALVIAGDRGGPALDVLVKGVTKLEQKTEALDDVQGRAHELAEQMQGPSSRAARELTSAVEELRLEAGGNLEPALAALLSQLRDIARESGPAANAIGTVLAVAVAKLNTELFRFAKAVEVTTFNAPLPQDFVNGFRLINESREIEKSREAVEALAEALEGGFQNALDAVIPPLTAEEKAQRAAAEAAEDHASRLEGLKAAIEQSESALGDYEEGLREIREEEERLAALERFRPVFIQPSGALDVPGADLSISDDPGLFLPDDATLRQWGDDLIEIWKDAAQEFGIEMGHSVTAAVHGALASGDVRGAARSLASDLAAGLGGLASNAFGGFGGQLLGGIVGGLAESLLGGLFKQGADEASVVLEVLGGQLQAVSGVIEGDLLPQLLAMTDGVVSTANAILAEFGGTLDAGRFGFKIRQGPEESIVRVFYLGLEREFEDQGAAMSFLIAQIISEGVVSGLGPSVAEAVAGGTFDSVEELVAAMRIGELIDSALRSPLDQFFEDQARNARMLLTEAAPLGISLERVVQAQAALTQATLDQHAAVVKSALGISSALDQWDELDHSIAILMPESLRQMEAELMAAAEQAQNLADTTGAAEAAFDRGIDSYREWLGELGVNERQIERLTTLHEEWTAAGLDQEEIMRRTSAELRDFAVELEGLPIDQMQRAARVMRLDFMGGLLSQMADVLRQTGNVEEANRLEAQSKELVLRMQILQIRATVQEAFARERLTAEQVQGYNEFIRMMQRGLNELIRTGGFATGGGGGGGGGIGGGDITSGIDEQAQALEFWNRIMQDATDTVLGITAAERARMDTEAELRRLNELNLISDERLAEALAAMEAAASHVEKPILDATQALQDNADAWQGFLGVLGGLADIKPDLFTLEDDLGSLSGALNSLGVELPVDQARALAGWEFELRRLRVLEILATKGAAAALGEHFLPIMQSVSDMTFDFDPPGSGSGRRTGASLGLGRAPGTGRGGGDGRNALEGLLDRLADWERDLEISLMDPLEAALARATDSGEAFIAQLITAGATNAAIGRAQIALARELEQISARAWEAALDPLRSLYDDLTTGPLSGANNAVQLEAARARFDDLQARAAGGDVQAARELEAAARDLLAAAQASNSALLITRIQGVVAAGLGGVLGIGDPGDDGGKPGDRPVILKPRDVVEPVHLTATDLMVVAAGGDLGTASALPRLADAFRGAVAPSGHIRLDTNGLETELRRQRDSATAEAAELRELVRELLAAQRERNEDANDADDVKIDLSAGQLRALSEVAEQPQPTVGTKA